MIGYLKGTILNFEPDGVLLLVDNMGYQVLLSPQVTEKIKSEYSDENLISLYIYYHQTERQPKPVLIGFETLEEKEFFQTFILVDAIGPMKAIKAMTRPVGEIAMAIEKKDVSFLSSLKGIGRRTAEKIIATLHGKVERFIAAVKVKEKSDEYKISSEMQNIYQQVADVLVDQLGHSPASAKRMIKEAFERNSMIATPEELFDEVFQKGT